MDYGFGRTAPSLWIMINQEEAAEQSGADCTGRIIGLELANGNRRPGGFRFDFQTPELTVGPSPWY
jgi:hypothetical protein